MADDFTMDTGARDVLPPQPDSEAASLNRVRVVFEDSNGRNCKAGTELMAATEESASDFRDRLNARLVLGHEAWNALSARIFAANPYREEKSASEPSHFPQ